jgi:cell division protein FtsN
MGRYWIVTKAWIATALFLAGIAATGCAGSRTAAPPPSEPPRDRPYDVDSEGTYPSVPPARPEADEVVTAPPGVEVDLPDIEEEDLAPPAEVPAESASTDSSAEANRPEAQTEEPPSVGPEAATSPAPAGDYRLGYRLQILATTDRARAEAVRSEAEARFGLPCYVEYEESLYKVRVGDFLDRSDAHEYLDILREKGYHDSWVVGTTVRVPSSP